MKTRSPEGFTSTSSTVTFHSVSSKTEKKILLFRQKTDKLIDLILPGQTLLYSIVRLLKISFCLLKRIFQDSKLFLVFCLIRSAAIYLLRHILPVCYALYHTPIQHLSAFVISEGSWNSESRSVLHVSRIIMRSEIS